MQDLIEYSEGSDNHPPDCLVKVCPLFLVCLSSPVNLGFFRDMRVNKAIPLALCPNRSPETPKVFPKRSEVENMVFWATPFLPVFSVIWPKL